MRHLQMSRWRTRTEDDGTVTVEGLAVPYGQVIDYAGFREQFAAEAFDTDTVTGAPLLRDHDRTGLVGHVTAARNTPEGLEVEAVVQPTSLGRDTATLLRSGSLRGLSVGFEPTDTDQRDGIATYRSATLHELSLTPMPAYPAATVAAVRHQQEEPVTTTEVPPEVTEERAAPVDLSRYALRTDLEALQARMAERTTEQPHMLGVREAFVEQLRASKDSRQIRALADVISGGNAGVLPPAWSSEVRGYIDRQRYLFPRTGTLGFPATGHTLTVPKITQHTTVAARGAEKSEIPSQELTTGSDVYSAAWYAGGVDVSLEVIWQSDPSIWSLVVDDLLGQYAIATDAAFTLAAETAAAPGGAALDFTSYGTFVAQIIDTAETIRAATGQPGDMLSMTTASWQSLLGLVDADGRRILATSGGTNADGSAGLTSTSVNVGGITCFHNPRAAEDMQYNEKSLRKAEKPPVTLTSDNVALMGRDVGVLGAIITLPLYPAGIVVYSAALRTSREGGAKK